MYGKSIYGKYGSTLVQIENESENKWLREQYQNIKTSYFDQRSII